MAGTRDMPHPRTPLMLVCSPEADTWYCTSPKHYRCCSGSERRRPTYLLSWLSCSRRAFSPKKNFKLSKLASSPAIKVVSLIYEPCGRCGLPYWTGEYNDGFGLQYIPNRCQCRQPKRQRVSRRRRSGNRKRAKKTSRLSIAEQLALLTELYERGSLTEQEFQTLKSRLISGGEL